MEFDADKIDDYTLALMYLVMHQQQGVTRAWKSFDWATTDRLHAKGYISDPQSNAKSVVMTEEGVRRAEELFRRFFGVEQSETDEGSDGDQPEAAEEVSSPLDDPRFE